MFVLICSKNKTSKRTTNQAFYFIVFNFYLFNYIKNYYLIHESMSIISPMNSSVVVDPSATDYVFIWLFSLEVCLSNDGERIKETAQSDLLSNITDYTINSKDFILYITLIILSLI